MKRVLVTGGCGFIGHHFVEHLINNTNFEIVIIDKLNYASKGFERLRSIEVVNNKRVKILTYDLAINLSEGMINEIGDINYIVHMAAETHVDNSISDPVYFINNNINSTLNILEYSKKLKNLELFFYFSTDEVYGPAYGDKLYKEDERHNPTNPYSASKSAAEQLCVSYHNTFLIPIVRVNVMNAFGERQHVEKFIPKVIRKIINKEDVLIHSYPDKLKSGSRFYIHARNISSAILFLIKNGKVGESYNITGEKEVSNLEIAEFISKECGMELKYKMVDFHSSRPGHDLRYGLDGKKISDLGWGHPVDFERSLSKTIQWTLDNQEWLSE